MGLGSARGLVPCVKKRILAQDTDSSPLSYQPALAHWLEKKLTAKKILACDSGALQLKISVTALCGWLSPKTRLPQGPIWSSSTVTQNNWNQAKRKQRGIKEGMAMSKSHLSVHFVTWTPVSVLIASSPGGGRGHCPQVWCTLRDCP